ncbi:MAG: ribonuclease P protein component [Bacteroidaceae bacterium]|nr:ribonuclease P protein component [Bacteroidaceae bacterium]
MEQPTPRNTFPLKEHLKSKKAIEKLYAEGASVTSFPLRAVFMEQAEGEQEPTAAILISVAKRRFKHAVDRNLLKRRMREAYRTEKHAFVETLEKSGKKVAVAIMYIDTKPSSTAYLKRKMGKLLNGILSKAEVVCEK